MIVRVGTVTNTYPSSGKVRVMYDDLGEASQPLPLLTYGNEYNMPSVGDMVVSLHMENGGSKGFVLGTYWGDGNVPIGAGNGVYYKDLGGGAYEKRSGSELSLFSKTLSLQCDDGGVYLSQLLTLIDRVTSLEERVSALDGQV